MKHIIIISYRTRVSIVEDNEGTKKKPRKVRKERRREVRNQRSKPRKGKR